MSAEFPLMGDGHLIDPRNGRETAVRYEIDRAGDGYLWDIPYGFVTARPGSADDPWRVRDSNGSLWQVEFADTGTNLDGPIAVLFSPYAK